jgi:hypothetical protein
MTNLDHHHTLAAKRLAYSTAALLQRRIYRRELGFQVRSKSVYDCDDRKRDASGDQAIFNGRGGRFVS